MLRKRRSKEEQELRDLWNKVAPAVNAYIEKEIGTYTEEGSKLFNSAMSQINQGFIELVRYQR